jgi:hypothetical protein
VVGHESVLSAHPVPGRNGPPAGAFDEFYDFLSTVKSLNPAIEIKRL